MRTKILFLAAALLFAGIAYSHRTDARPSTSTFDSENKGVASWLSRLFTRNTVAKAGDDTYDHREDECLDKPSGTWILCTPPPPIDSCGRDCGTPERIIYKP
jgi:hypothetical protein